MFATYSGLVSTDPYLYDSKILLANAAVDHTLVLTEFGENGYKPTPSVGETQDGRTLSGQLQITGVGYQSTPDVEISCMVNATQLSVFEELVYTARINRSYISFIDKFKLYIRSPTKRVPHAWLFPPITNAAGYLQGFAVWNANIVIGGNYAEYMGNDDYLLQFSIKIAV